MLFLNIHEYSEVLYKIDKKKLYLFQKGKNDLFSNRFITNHPLHLQTTDYHNLWTFHT